MTRDELLQRISASKRRSALGEPENLKEGYATGRVTSGLYCGSSRFEPEAVDAEPESFIKQSVPDFPVLHFLQDSLFGSKFIQGF